MLEVVADRKSIKGAQKEFKKRLLVSSNIKVPCWVGYRGGSFEYSVHWSSSNGIWCCFDTEEHYFWNPFGTQEPEKHANLSIISEINFPFDGINRRFGGIFLTDGKAIYLGHRGKIGGGRKGIGKRLFMDNYRGKMLIVKDGSIRSKVALISQLDEDTLPFKVSKFVREVERIKDLV